MHAISLTGEGNLLIANSGTVKTPAWPDVGEVIGHVDLVSISEDGANVVVHGWACHERLQKVIDVHVYVGGPAGSDSVVTTASTTANSGLANELSAQCGDNLGHRYTAVFPYTDEIKFSSRDRLPVHVYGIASDAQDSRELHPFGAFEVPIVDIDNVIGVIDSVEVVGAGTAKEVLVRGWACRNGLNKQINVHAYVGGSAGAEGAAIANGAAANEGAFEEGIAERCGDRLPHRFAIRFPPPAGEMLVFVHGIGGGTF